MHNGMGGQRNELHACMTQRYGVLCIIARLILRISWSTYFLFITHHNALRRGWRMGTGWRAGLFV